jgi:2-polyprenyl-3-methyl-5-hydroxy-6-metoxy-1,4-benzoquinol methylase
MSEFNYIGSELDIFEQARHWKAYWGDRIKPFVKGDVLEVGAGIGANTRALTGLGFRSWLCLEPDCALAGQIKLPSPDRHEVAVGTVADLGGRTFDTILYADVLEHIEHDRREMELALARLKPGGVMLVLSPAHPSLFTAFDEAVGHYRRYTIDSLRKVAPKGTREVKMEYLDSVGVLASLANRMLLGSSQPTLKQIHTWDTFMIPCSRVLDPLCRFRLGKSVLGAWQRAE